MREARDEDVAAVAEAEVRRVGAEGHPVADATDDEAEAEEGTEEHQDFTHIVLPINGGHEP